MRCNTALKWLDSIPDPPLSTGTWARRDGMAGREDSRPWWPMSLMGQMGAVFAMEVSRLARSISLASAAGVAPSPQLWRSTRMVATIRADFNDGLVALV